MSFKILLFIIISTYLVTLNGKISRTSEQFIRKLTGEGCCARCMGVKSELKANLTFPFPDSTDFQTCGAAKLCCFENDCSMSAFGEPSIKSKPVVIKNEATVPSGTYFQITWSGAEKVHYMIVGNDLIKKNQVLNSSDHVTANNGYFSICADTPGTLYYRAFASNGCKGSSEKKITISKNPDSTVGCTAPPVPTSNEECNLNRASYVDGECVCASDWSGPPTCRGMPTWKWAITAAGAIAALLSICFTIYAFITHRKKKKNEDDKNYVVETPTDSLKSFDI